MNDGNGSNKSDKNDATARLNQLLNKVETARGIKATTRTKAKPLQEQNNNKSNSYEKVL
jgi:hypothetical protein